MRLKTLWRDLYWDLAIRLRWLKAPPERAGIAVGERLPDFVLRDLAGLSHESARTIPGKAAVLWLTNFCDSCRDRIPFLESVYAAHRDRLEIYAVSALGAERERPERAAREYRVHFPVLLDPDDWTARHLGLPHPPGACPLYNLLLVDAGGRVRLKHHLSAIGDGRFLDALREIGAAAR